MPLTDLDQEDHKEDDDEDEDHATSTDCCKDCHLGAEEAIRGTLRVLVTLINGIWDVGKENRKDEVDCIVKMKVSYLPPRKQAHT